MKIPVIVKKILFLFPFTLSSLCFVRRFIFWYYLIAWWKLLAYFFMWREAELLRRVALSFWIFMGIQKGFFILVLRAFYRFVCSELLQSNIVQKCLVKCSVNENLLFFIQSFFSLASIKRLSSYTCQRILILWHVSLYVLPSKK